MTLSPPSIRSNLLFCKEVCKKSSPQSISASIVGGRKWLFLALLLAGCSGPGGPGRVPPSHQFDVITEFEKEPTVPLCSEVTVGTYPGKDYAPECRVK